MGRNLSGAQGGTGCFDHHAQTVGKGRAAFRFHRRCDLVDAGLDQLNLAFGRNKGDHDLGHHGVAIAAGFDRSLKDRTGLHLVDFGHRHAKTHAAQAEHRVIFGHSLDPPGHVGQRQIQRLGQIALTGAGRRQEFVQGRIEQTDAHRLTLHDAEKLNEIIALHWQQAF